MGCETLVGNTLLNMEIYLLNGYNNLEPGSSKTRQPRDTSKDRDPKNHPKEMILMYDVIRNFDFDISKICQLDYEIRTESRNNFRLLLNRPKLYFRDS